MSPHTPISKSELLGRASSTSPPLNGNSFSNKARILSDFNSNQSLAVTSLPGTSFLSAFDDIGTDTIQTLGPDMDRAQAQSSFVQDNIHSSSPLHQPQLEQQSYQQPPEDPFQQQRLALQRQHCQALIQAQRLQLHQRKHQQEQRFHSIDQRKQFAPPRHYSFSGPTSSSPFSPLLQSSQQGLLSNSYQQQQQPYSSFSASTPLSTTVSSSSSHPLHPLHPLQYLHPLSHQEQQQQLQQEYHPGSFSTVSFSSSNSPASVLANSSVNINALTESISSMGVLAMPPLSLHSLNSYTSAPHPIQSSSFNSQQQLQKPVQDGHLHSSRHSPLSNPDQAADHIHLLEERQQLQLQPSLNVSRLSSNYLPAQQPAAQASYSGASVRSEASQPQASSLQRGSISSSGLPSLDGQDIPVSTAASDVAASIGSSTSSSPSGVSWIKTENTLNNHRLLDVPGASVHLGESASEIIRRFSYSSVGSDIYAMSTTGMVDENDPMSNYSLEARILQKKDQLEELSATGTVISTPIVEEVRTGQQFLIKLHLSRKGPNQSLRYPSLRVGRREAINAAGEPRFEAEPLTLEIGIRLAKSGSVRKGACAKCCHKYGPSSPILVLLDQLSPSVTDPAAYAHVDTTTGSITMLAKVICSSTDHGERGNKDRYIFDFRLKRTSSMSTTIATSSSASPAPSDATDEDGEILSTFFTHPIMCSGHHKAKRTAYPHQRPSKVTKAGPTPKIKTIKRHKSAPNIAWPPQGALIDAENVDNLNLNGPIGSNNGFPSTINYLPEHLSQLPLVSAYTDPTNGEPRANINNQSLTSQSASEMEQHPISQHPRILEVRPDNGPIRKRTDVVLRGLFFREGMVPYFGVFPAQDIIVETSGLIICKVPESSMPGTVPITIVDSMNNSYGDLGQFTYTDDGETELLILQLQLRLAHRALEYLHTQATGQKGNVDEIMRSIPGLSNAPRSNGALMMDSSEPLLSLSEVEDSILEILNHIPKDMDISIQLEDGSNLLHLAILMGLHRLAIRLIEEGCDIESQDDYGMTPLMYAVFKGNELIARSLIVAGATTSGARTPEEFYESLPREVEPTPMMLRFLSVSCPRHSGAQSIFAMDIMEEGEDEEESEEWTNSINLDGSQSQEFVYSSSLRPVAVNTSELRVAADERHFPSSQNPERDLITTLENTIQNVRINREIPPLDQQALPPMRTVETDGSVTINTQVIKGSELAPASGQGAELYMNVNPESGYHTGICSEVQERLNRLHQTTLPSDGVQMEVLFKKLTPANRASTTTLPVPSSFTPLELFRTGDSFAIEIRLSTLPGEDQVSLPSEYIGIKFPHEMVKRVSGRPAVILTDMTYILKTTIELGNTRIEASTLTEQTHEVGQGDGIALAGSCQACSKFLHEHKKLSPSRRSMADPSVYPILQFNVPGGASSSYNPSTVDTSQAASSMNNPGVVGLREGVCEVKAKVNCSSLHHLVQRERARHAERKAQRQQQSDLRDPGFVFKFELIHPTENRVVARYETRPIMFQSYSRGRN